MLYIRIRFEGLGFSKFYFFFDFFKKNIFLFQNLRSLGDMSRSDRKCQFLTLSGGTPLLLVLLQGTMGTTGA